MRSISHSEASAALDCQAKHAFAYTGQLTSGDTLRPKSAAPQLRAGRAWGRAVAAWHANAGPTASVHAHTALEIALSLDSAQQQQHGVFDQAEHDQLQQHLLAVLADYVAHVAPLPVTRPEYQLDVAIPSRTGRRRSNVYRLLCYLDGVHTDADGRDWIVEYKLRNRLQPFEQIALSRQVRWYAWAWREHTGRAVAGVIVDERLNETPAPVRFNQNGTISKVQSCRPDAYIAACQEHDQAADVDAVRKLEAKRWGARHELILSDRELREAGWQLTSAASLIHQLDTGLLFPVRNPSPMRCPSCAYRDICADAQDAALVDALFERTQPKRERKDTADAAPVR